MAVTPSQRAIFNALLAKYDRQIAEAFLIAIGDLRSGVDLTAVIRALSTGDLNGAITALNLDPAALQPLTDAITAAYRQSGTATASGFPAFRSAASGARMLIRFNPGNPRAEAWLRDRSSQLVTRILQDQRATIRTALETGMQAGDNPRTTALNVVGRIDRATGKRTGGVIGLSAPQEAYARAAEAELASGDPALLRNYLTRTRRDKRFDHTILKAIDKGEPIQAETRQKMVMSYRNSLLKLRGDTIARTESLASLHAAQDEAYRQAVDSGAVTATQVRRTWRSAHDLRVRHSHSVLDGESVGLDGIFVSPSGARMRFPGDTSLGAGPEEIINCRCLVSTRIDFLANIR